ncbi:MAG: hypothetical protein AB1Z98_03035 [Nannocystaceae bacterium]
MRSSFIILSLFCLLSSACEPELHGLDHADPVETIVRQPLPLEGTTTAYAMLRVANERSFTELDHEVGLDRRAAQSIMAFRAGDDGDLFTADDRYLSTLSELDELYWLGEDNLWTLQRYALLEGDGLTQLPADDCPPLLIDAIESCLRGTARRAEVGVSRANLVAACLVQGDPIAPSHEYFEAAGLPDYLDPWLGYHGLLCGDEDPGPLCALGVAGMAGHHGPACDARYDTP